MFTNMGQNMTRSQVIMMSKKNLMKNAFLKYCKFDTLWMVRVLEKLREISYTVVR
jgi:hypothetical protein